MTVLPTFAEFATTLTSGDIPDVVRSRTTTILRHNLVVALASRSLRVAGQDVESWPDELPPQKSATRLTDGCRAPDEYAVLTNALAMGARAQHDEQQDAVSHFGSTVVPPLLAAAEQSGASGEQFVTAMVVGYEIGARIGAASVQAVTARGFRPTGLYGPIAGAAAVGTLLGFDTERLTNAMALACSSSAGLMQTWVRGTSEWQYQTAFAARNGYVAAQLAAGGVDAAQDTMEGARGFHAAFVGDEVDTQSMFAGLGHRWAVDHVLLKPYPVCALNQAPVQQLLDLQVAHGFEPFAIDSIRVRLNPHDRAYPGVDMPAPVTTRAAALMSLQTSLAIAAIERDVSIEALERPDTPTIRTLASRVELIDDTSVSRHESSVDVVFRGNTVSTAAPRGVVYDEIAAADLLRRLQPSTGLSQERLADVTSFIESLDAQSDVSDMYQLIAPA